MRSGSNKSICPQFRSTRNVAKTATDDDAAAAALSCSPQHLLPNVQHQLSINHIRSFVGSWTGQDRTVVSVLSN